ncbi:hypothetical protein [Candidatus Poriferisodalis sp.]|uniref:hypothetical protein n=1 Tax=Candidatus Poriferisodalis sp. TaxID=3101277 RepID=UPI003B0100FB
MADLVVRDVPEEVMAIIDSNAAFRGVSRAEYLRDLLSHQRDMRPLSARATEFDEQSEEAPTLEEALDGFRRLAETFADARDPEIMANAWR